MAAKYRIECFLGREGDLTGKYYFHVKAGGRVVLTSEGYTRRYTCDKIAGNLLMAMKQGIAVIVYNYEQAPARSVK